MIFNNTKTIAIICNNDELSANISKAFELTKQVIKEREGKKIITHDDSLQEKPRIRPTRYSIFKFFNEFENNFNLDENWLKNIYRLADSNYQTVRKEIATYLPEYSKLIKITQNDARGLISDLRLFLHCCWACKFVLLPLNFNELPKVKYGSNGSSVEYAKAAYPEMLKIIRSPFYKDLDYAVDITPHMSKSALPNFSWYAYRYVRACAAWEIEDITNELLSIMSQSPRQNYPRTVDWYLALHACFPERVKFDRQQIYARSNSGIQGTAGKSTIKNFSPSEQDKNPSLTIWIKDINSYVDELKNKGIKDYKTHQNIIRRAIHILIQSNVPLPAPSEINRTHLKMMINYLNQGIMKSTLKSYMYKLEDFFSYVEIIYPNFKSPISRKLDFPISRRSKGTKKKILSDSSFSPYLSYLYGLAEWVWYVNEHHSEPENILKQIKNTNGIIETSSTGFIPLFRIDGKYYPINEIPTSIVPMQYPKVSGGGQIELHCLRPNYINLSVVLAETGIRLIALRWLDSETYDKDVDRDYFSERSYLISQLWVNTDKAHDAWSADVSESVIAILDRQASWKKKYLEGLDLPRHYDGHENSSFEMIRPLFAVPNSNLELSDSFSVVSDNSCRGAFKSMIVHFFYIYAKAIESDAEFSGVEVEKTLLQNLSQKTGKGSPPLDITPHSMRAQVVSNLITILPPSVIKKITGHIDDAHIMYYVKIDSIYLNAQRASQEEEFKKFLSPTLIDTKNGESSLQQAFKRNVEGAITDFGAISFSDNQSKVTRSGLSSIRNKLVDHLAFNATHICPFKNECPEDILKDSNSGLPKCGECPYSVKTVDHLPAIAAKIRALTDKTAELQDIIREAKTKYENMSAYTADISLRKYYAGEISAWAITLTCLEQMATKLSKRNKWLTGKPDFIAEHLQKLESSNELTSTLIRIKEAESFQEFLTPQLKAKVAMLRNKILAQTGQFQELMGEPPTGRELLIEFKGIIKSICDITKLDISELPQALEEISANTQNILGNTLSFPALTKDSDNE